MKRIILAVAILFSPGVFAACEITGTGLPDNVVQKLKTDCEVLRLEQKNKEAAEEASGVGSLIPDVTPERVTGWAQVAEGFANAIGAAARQLNISVNEFITTPAGLITVGVILWKVIGVSVLKLLAMYFVFVLCMSLLKAMWRVGSEPVERSFLWWKWTKQKPVYSTWKNAEDTMCGMGFLVIAVGTVLEVVLIISLT